MVDLWTIVVEPQTNIWISWIVILITHEPSHKKHHVTNNLNDSEYKNGEWILGEYVVMGFDANVFMHYPAAVHWSKQEW